ncbi:hypothetical protein EIP91_001658 [Steccherinum ochraceum]|uniref:SH3 domain-containing protein n=1 Tax=Steccherinum ochraceum TaxID=92696 RepID=A0A4R0RDN7_9APHY|nr:hypothetical protein EIP91_001658 [Steccherinum ochraceum]
MPIVPSVSQLLSSNANQQQQPSPTATNPSRRTPPPPARISPVTGKIASGPTNGREHSPERLNSPPPPLVHSHTQPIPQQLVSSLQQSQTNVLAHHPRPINRAHPSFLSQLQNAEEKWHITDELMADFERAEQQGQLQGTSGVAYAGGAVSTMVHAQHTPTTARDPAVERVRLNDRSSPKESAADTKRQVTKEREPQSTRESPKTRERSQTTSSVVPPRVDQEVVSQDRPEYRASPPYQTPMTSPAERTAAYTQYVPDSYQSAASLPPSRKPVPPIATDQTPSRMSPSGLAKVSTQSPPSQAANPRPAARSLPVQEEPEEDVAHEEADEATDYPEHRSPKQSPDIYNGSHSPRYENVRPHRNGSRISGDDDDDETLNEVDDAVQQDKSGDDEDSGFTPRSPSTTLPERSRDSPYNGINGSYGSLPPQFSQTALADLEQKTVRAKHRSAHSDHLNMRGFDPALFEQTVSALRNSSGQHVQEQQQQQQQQPSAQQALPTPRSEVPSQLSHYGTNGQYASMVPPSQASYSSPAPPPISTPLEHLFDDPTSSYLRSFYTQSANRPRAPIPPTPQSNTSAPSPSPAISAIQGEHEARQMGSPYPYPFTHIRRTAPFAPPNAPSSSFDQNNPALVREQLALQMQIYALNNGLAAPSDSTFSPSSTPFPGPGYNPWGLHHQGILPGDTTMSMRSSPSHEPIPMPTLPIRGRGLRRRGNTHDLRVPQNGSVRRKVKPPPRVESTQPRDTSPEPSSGEETAGEERFVDQYGSSGTEVVWAEGPDGLDTEDIGEWVDENDEDAGEDDLLQLEYHPTFVTRTDKRRRRWETRWDALVQAFQALDRETDTTMVLLAAPSHTSKLHSITSRSIRRDPMLVRSEPLTHIRANFHAIAAQRKATRSVKRLSLADHLSSAPSTSGDGSQVGESREEDLRRALGAALGSLGALGTLYDQREARWREEMRRVSEDREHVELLLRQALGPALAGQDTNHHAPSASVHRKSTGSPFPSPSSAFLTPPEDSSHESRPKSDRLSQSMQPLAPAENAIHLPVLDGESTPTLTASANGPESFASPITSPITPTPNSMMQHAQARASNIPPPINTRTVSTSSLSAAQRESLTSSRPAPPSPAISRRTSAALSRHSSSARSTRQSKEMSASVTSAATRRASKVRSWIFKVRDFAFSQSDERHEGRGPDAPRPNRPRHRNSTLSTSSTSSTPEEGNEDQDEELGRHGWGSFRWNTLSSHFSWGNKPSEQEEVPAPSHNDFARNFDASSPTEGAVEEEEESGDDEEYEYAAEQDGPLAPGLYRALYAFEPEGAAEMALEEGQVIKIIARGGGVGWAVVEKEDGEHALVPEGYLELVQAAEEEDE